MAEYEDQLLPEAAQDLRDLDTPLERLTAQFYNWERRGRGWHLWGVPVEPEPPFVPFEVHWVPPTRVIDDGRRPTFISRVADRIQDFLQGPSSSAVLDSIDVTLPYAEPEWCEHEGSIVDLRVTVPQAVKVSREATVQFLTSLPRTEHPMSFEVVGREDQITMQLACYEEDVERVRAQLHAYFPDAVAVREDQPIASLWSQNPEHFQLVIDFGLSREFMLPLRTTRGFDIDPLTGVFGSLTNLQEQELGALQVLFQPVRHPWASSIVHAVHDEEGKPFFLDAPEVTALAREKIATPLFACVVRVGVCAPSLERVWSVARGLGGALRVMGRPDGNELIPLAPDFYDHEEHVADFLARRSRRTGMLLSCDELATLAHLPAHTVRIEKLLRVVKKTRALPSVAIGNEHILGSNLHAGKSIDVSLNPEQRSQHTYVVGASGTGKSTLLLQMILQDLEAGEGLAVLDPHGDLVDQVLQRMPLKRIEDVVLVDPSDTDHSVGFNILSARTELERTLLESDLVAVFRRLSTSWGDQMTSVLSNAILAILESDRGGTLLDLRRFLVEKAWRNEYLQSVRDPNVVYYWKNEFPLLAHKPHASILTRLNTFLRTKPILRMVAQQDRGLDIGRIMNEGKVLLARISQGAIGIENTYLLGTLLVAKFQQLAMTRQELAVEERKPFYLYVDEFQNFVTPTMEAILSGTRKYRLGLILAHQDFQQIAKIPEVLTAVLTNPYTRICFRVGDRDARTLEDGFAHFDRTDLQNLSRREAIARVERADFDFTLTTRPLESTPELSTSRDDVISHTRSAYARPRHEIDAIVAEAIGAAQVTEDAPPPPQEKSAPGAPASPVPPPSRSPVAREQRLEVPPTPEALQPEGRGSRFHRYLQSLIKSWAEKNKWRATIEEAVLDGAGVVDVALRKGDVSVACEIAVTTKPDHELDNVQKCIAAGFDYVAVVCAEKKNVAKLRSLVTDALPEDIHERVQVTRSEDLLAVLEHVEAQVASTTSNVRGYKVNLKLRPVSESEKDAKRGAVSRVIAKALRRMKRDE